MATEQDLNIIKQIRELLGQVNNLVVGLGPDIHVKFETMERTSVSKHYPTPHIFLKADERQRL